MRDRVGLAVNLHYMVHLYTLTLISFPSPPGASHSSLGIKCAIFLLLSLVLVHMMFVASLAQSTLLNMVLPVMSETIELKIELFFPFFTVSRPQSSPALQTARLGSSEEVQKYFPRGSNTTPLAAELWAEETSRILTGERTLEPEAGLERGAQTQIGAVLSRLRWEED